MLRRHSLMSWKSSPKRIVGNRVCYVERQSSFSCGNDRFENPETKVYLVPLRIKLANFNIALMSEVNLCGGLIKKQKKQQGTRYSIKFFLAAYLM